MENWWKLSLNYHQIHLPVPLFDSVKEVILCPYGFYLNDWFVRIYLRTLHWTIEFMVIAQFVGILFLCEVAERLELPTTHHGVLGSNLAAGEVLLEPKRCFIAQSLTCSPFHCPDMTEILLKRMESAKPSESELYTGCQKNNHSPGPGPGRQVPSSHQRSELNNTILSTFSRGDKRIWKCIPIPNGLEEKATLLNISVSNGDSICHRMMIPAAPNQGDKVICWYTGRTLQTFV